MAKRCWVPRSTFSFSNPKDRQDLVTFANKKAGGSKYTWLESCIAQSKIMMQKLLLRVMLIFLVISFLQKAQQRLILILHT